MTWIVFVGFSVLLNGPWNSIWCCNIYTQIYYMRNIYILCWWKVYHVIEADPDTKSDFKTIYFRKKSRGIGS